MTGVRRNTRRKPYRNITYTTWCAGLRNSSWPPEKKISSVRHAAVNSSLQWTEHGRKWQAVWQIQTESDECDHFRQLLTILDQSFPVEVGEKWPVSNVFKSTISIFVLFTYNTIENTANLFIIRKGKHYAILPHNLPRCKQGGGGYPDISFTHRRGKMFQIGTILVILGLFLDNFYEAYFYIHKMHHKYWYN